MASSSSLAGFQRAPRSPTPPVEKAGVTTPDFNPFAALGIQQSKTIIPSQLKEPYRRALRHHDSGATARFPATTDLFPSQVQVMTAFFYLEIPRNAETAWSVWRKKALPPQFCPEHPVGDPRVFPNIPSTPQPPTDHTSLSSTYSMTTGAGFKPFDSTRSSPSPFPPTFGPTSGSSQDPIDLSGSPSPPPNPKRRRPSLIVISDDESPLPRPPRRPRHNPPRQAAGSTSRSAYSTSSGSHRDPHSTSKPSPTGV